MKKVLLSLCLLGLLVMMPMRAMAGEVTDAPTTSIDTVGEVIDVLNTLVDWLYTLLLIVAAGYLVWGGLDYVLGGGEAEKIESGRNKVKYALIGVAVAVVSKGLMNIVQGLVD